MLGADAHAGLTLCQLPPPAASPGDRPAPASAVPGVRRRRPRRPWPGRHQGPSSQARAVVGETPTIAGSPSQPRPACSGARRPGRTASTRRSRLRSIMSADPTVLSVARRRRFVTGPGAEVEDAGVLEPAAHDAAHPDVVRQAGHPGPQAADGPHDQVDPDARLRGRGTGRR